MKKLPTSWGPRLLTIEPQHNRVVQQETEQGFEAFHKRAVEGQGG